MKLTKEVLNRLTTPQLMVYAELMTNQIDELDKYGMDVRLCESYGGISKTDMEKIHNDLALKISNGEEARISLVAEINRRMKKDLKIDFGPSDVQPYLNKYQKEFPLIGKGEAEIKAFNEKKKQESKTLNKV